MKNHFKAIFFVKILIFFSFNLHSIAPLEYYDGKYCLVSFFSGEYQNFAGPSAYLGFHASKQVDTKLQSPNYYSLGFKGGKIDESLDKLAWFLKREIALTHIFSFTLQYNHTAYKVYNVGENVLSGILNFQGFFNPTNLLYASFGLYFRAPVYDNYFPFNFKGSGSELFFLIKMGYKYFTKGNDAFSIDINNYNEFHIYNFNNVGFDFSFSSYFSRNWYYIANIEIRTSGFIVGTGMISEEKFFFGIGVNF